MSTNQFQMTILYEDDDLLIINKPAGIVVNDAQTVPGETIQGRMALLFEKNDFTQNQTSWLPLLPSDFNPEFGTPLEIFKERQGMVHRLDKETSGVLIWAKNPGSLVHLLTQFKNRQVQKAYVALVHGKVAAPKATLSYPLARATRDRKLFAVSPEGRPAITEYTTQAVFTALNPEKISSVLWPALQAQQLEKSENRFLQGIKTEHELLRRLRLYQGFSLLKCHPLTGRTHQIRVHLAHVRHPIVGDKTYVGKKRQSLDPLWCPRQFLHAAELQITHPRTGKIVLYEAPLAGELQATLDLLQ